MNVIRSLWSALANLTNNVQALADTVAAANDGLRERLALVGPAQEPAGPAIAALAGPQPEPAAPPEKRQLRSGAK